MLPATQGDHHTCPPTGDPQDRVLPGAPPPGVGRSARVNCVGHALDASKRSQILFMDRDNILNLCVVTNLPLPTAAWPGAILFSDGPKADGTMPNRT
jgi:hypothetical protein